jgi:hypothetical protein
MPDSIRLVPSPAQCPPVAKRSLVPPASEWSDSYSMMRGGVLGVTFGAGLWAAIFGFLILMKVGIQYY